MRVWVLLGISCLIAGCGTRTSLETTLDVSSDPGREVDLILVAGQSNAGGVDPANRPPGLPDASIPMWLNSYHYDDGSRSWGDMRVDPHGHDYAHEIATARRMQAAGLRVGIIKLTKGGTFINRWPPGARSGHPGSKFYDELAEALAAAPAAFSGQQSFRLHFIWDQGEAEARYRSRSVVEAWGERYGEIRDGVQMVANAFYDSLGQPRQPVLRHVVRTCSTIAGKTFPGLLESEQEGAAPDDAHWHDTNDLVFAADNVHRTGFSQSLLGERLASQIVADVLALSATGAP